MPNLKNYKLLVSHSWHYSDHYNSVTTWLDNTSYFHWSNYSVSADNPLDTDTDYELKQKLTYRIGLCNAVVILSGMYSAYSEWIEYEIKEAVRLGKPIIAVRPWGQERIPSVISENYTVLVGWNSSSVISAIRTHAN